jgi:dolichyl-phosphate beta-glucosyltransferase
VTRTGRALDLELIVPALNEEQRLPATLDGLRAELARLPLRAGIVVVDNGSVDRTAALVQDRGAGRDGAVPVRVIGCAQAGKGAAVRRGIEVSTARWVGFCDADLATAPECLRPALTALVDGHRAVIGSRSHPRSHVEVRTSRLRHLGAWAFRRYAASVVPDVSDTQCGFKFFDGAVARAAAKDLVTTGFAFDVELLALVRRYAPLLEIPVIWNDVAGSTFSPRRDGAASFREVAAIRRRLRALPPVPVEVDLATEAGSPAQTEITLPGVAVPAGLIPAQRTPRSATATKP